MACSAAAFSYQRHSQEEYSLESKNKHLSLEDRFSIEKGLNNGSTKTAIAAVVGKSSSTIGKEIRKHRTHSPAPPYKEYGQVIPNVVRDCTHIASGCPYGGTVKGNKCFSPCDHRESIPCDRRDKKLVCNGCSKLRSCPLEKYKYDAEMANREYREELSQSRIGLNMTPEHFHMIGTLLGDLMAKGQSVEVIAQNHPEIELSSRRLQELINSGCFKDYGVDKFSKRRTINRKATAKKTVYKPRNDRSHLKNRLMKDYQEYTDSHPEAVIWQMDTVYNGVSGGPFIQTFIHPDSSFMIGILHQEKTAQSMLNGIRMIRHTLGATRFKKIFSVILTDRGSEFTKAEETEMLGIKIFYCDPMHSYQKAEVEKNHTLLRYICPKGVDLYEAGLRSQQDLDLIFSHLNSYRRIHKFNKTPYENIIFLLEDKSLPKDLGIEKVDQDNVMLRPGLIKKK